MANYHPRLLRYTWGFSSRDSIIFILSVMSSTQVSLRLRLISIEAQVNSVIDLKLDNILVGFEHPSVIEDFAQKQAENPMPRKIKDGRAIYLSHNDFGTPKSFLILPKIVDFGLAQSGEYSPLMHPIQAPPFHAPRSYLKHELDLQRRHLEPRCIGIPPFLSIIWGFAYEVL
jgi:hypothetical protein